MTVPEATMDEDDDPVTGKDHVGPAWQVPPMQAKAEAANVKQSANGHLRRGITRSYSAHIEAALIRSESIDHAVRLPTQIISDCSTGTDTARPEGTGGKAAATASNASELATKTATLCLSASPRLAAIPACRRRSR